jgi:endoglucanase
VQVFDGIDRVRVRLPLLLLGLACLAACAADPEPQDAGSLQPPPQAGSGGAVSSAGKGGMPSIASGGTSGAPMTKDAGTHDAGTTISEPDAATPTPDGGTSASGFDPSASDDIFGTLVPRADSFWVDGGRIYRGADEVRLFGVNWFGLEGTDRALFGPAQSMRSVADILSQVKQLGFTALRVPLSPDSINSGNPSAGWANHGDVDTGREQFEELARAAADAGLYMLLDVHNCSSSVGFGSEGPTDPKCNGYDVERWLGDLRTLADVAAQYAPHVVGIDLFNEPYGLSHAEWKALAEQAGRAVLERNPKLLVFVEGIGAEGYDAAATHDGPFWGENLTGVAGAPIDLPASRLVYSPHVYGPSVYAQEYFAAADFPGNMPAIWDKHFGYLFGGQAPIVVGEFGGKYTDSDKVWQDAFVAYLREKGARSFFYWCLNPNSGDTGGVLQDDWRTPQAGKVALLQMLMQ